MNTPRYYIVGQDRISAAFDRGLAVGWAAALNRLNGVSLGLSRRHFPNVAHGAPVAAP